MLDNPEDGPQGDPVHIVADHIASQTAILCLDEMQAPSTNPVFPVLTTTALLPGQVSDIADAMILRQLFERLMLRGVVCVFTSNRAPEELYAGGLNRKYFMPFVELLASQCHVIHVDQGVDYRYLPEGAKGLFRRNGGGAFFQGAGAQEEWQALWENASQGQALSHVLTLPFGRSVSECVVAEDQAGDEGREGGSRWGRMAKMRRSWEH